MTCTCRGTMRSSAAILLVVAASARCCDGFITRPWSSAGRGVGTPPFRSSHHVVGRSSLTVATANLKPYLEKLVEGEDLSAADTEDAWMQIMEGALPEQVAALLCLMRVKGETPSEIAGCVRGMKNLAVPVHVAGRLLDIVGTGGDGAHTINVSTASVVLAAAAGAKVCKFGNRSVSSLCGSADVLEALGIRIDLTPEQVAECCERSGIAFMFAPNHYPAMRNVAPVRKNLGVRTVFNILGPMTNPAGAQHAVIGVFDETLMPIMAGALQEVGFIEHAVIVHGAGLDEISPLGPSKIIEIKNVAAEDRPKQYETKEYMIDPRDYGFPECAMEDLRGGDRDMNARLLREALGGGAWSSNAKKDAITLNAGIGLYVYGLAPTIEASFELAKNTLESGAALTQLDKWITSSNVLR